MKPGLADMKNAIVVPHIASASKWNREGMATLVALNVRFNSTQANLDKMAEIEAQYVHGECSQPKDGYCEVVKTNKKGRLRLRVRGATKARDMKKAKTDYIVAEEYLHSIKTTLINDVVPHVANIIMAKFQAANPGISLNVPDIHIAAQQLDPSLVRNQHSCALNGQSSVGTNLTNGVSLSLSLSLDPVGSQCFGVNLHFIVFLSDMFWLLHSPS